MEGFEGSRDMTPEERAEMEKQTRELDAELDAILRKDKRPTFVQRKNKSE